MNKIKVTLLAALVSLILFAFSTMPFSQSGNFWSEFLLVTILIFLPLFLVSIVVNIILEWVFIRMNAFKLAHKIIISLFITIAFSASYILITWVLVGSLNSIIKDSLALIVLFIILVMVNVTLSSLLLIPKQREKE